MHNHKYIWEKRCMNAHNLWITIGISSPFHIALSFLLLTCFTTPFLYLFHLPLPHSLYTGFAQWCLDSRKAKHSSSSQKKGIILNNYFYDRLTTSAYCLHSISHSFQILSSLFIRSKEKETGEKLKQLYIC